MLAAMVFGMVVTGAIFLSAVGLKTWSEVTVEYPNEMAVVMLVPVLPFL